MRLAVLLPLLPQVLQVRKVIQARRAHPVNQAHQARQAQQAPQARSAHQVVHRARATVLTGPAGTADRTMGMARSASRTKVTTSSKVVTSALTGTEVADHIAAPKEGPFCHV